MAIDRTKRDRLRNALIGYMQMHISSRPFDLCVCDSLSKTEDHSLIMIARFLWGIYDDLRNHLILHDPERVEHLLAHPWVEPRDDKRIRQEKEGWLWLCRTQVFLKTDLELDPTLKKRQISRHWDEYIHFFPFASAEEAESYRSSWLDFTPAFDPEMMAWEIAQGNKLGKPGWASKVLDFRLWG